MSNKFFGLNLDFLGFSASLICAVHCVALPFLLTLAPLTGFGFLENPWLEYSFISFSFIVASFSLIHGYKKHHKKKSPLAIVAAGFILVATGHSFEDSLHGITILATGAILISIAHYLNWKFLWQS